MLELHLKCNKEVKGKNNMPEEHDLFIVIICNIYY